MSWDLPYPPVPLKSQWYDMHSNPISNENTGSGNHHQIPSRTLQTIQIDLVDANHFLRQLIRRVREDVRKKVQCPLPPPVEIEDRVFDSRFDLLQYLSGIQRGFLELLGAIRWIVAWDGDIDANLGYVTKDAPNLKTKVEEWALRRPGGRGVLVDLERDWREVNIALYVDHGIPVHYLWTPDLQLDPRFRSLSPIFLGASIKGFNRPLPDWVERFSQPLVTTHSADQFLQLYYPPRAVSKLSSGPSGVKMETVVVDFEGWKARSMNFKNDIKEYMRVLWYDEESGKSNGQPWSQRTFHR